MEVSSGIVEDFRRLFTGFEQAHGVFQPGVRAEPGQKQEGNSFAKAELVTTDLYEDHLRGKQGLGIVPAREDGTCSFAVIDVDIYDSSPLSIVRAVYKNKIPLIPFRSKSGGLHLYLFLSVVCEVRKVVQVMNQYRKLFQLKKSTEIFPKQNIIEEGKVGSWINIPYFNILDSRQYMYGIDGGPMEIEEALSHIKANRVSYERMTKLMEELPLDDAPPCLQSIYLLGTTMERNQYLFSLARYYKAKEGDDFEFPLMEANNELDNPLKPQEISDTIIKTHKKKNYSYKCKEEPICSLCDKTLCKERKYGIGGSEVSDISYEDFIQYGIEEPTYKWFINGKGLLFMSESDIINQTRFRELCFKELHILPFKLTEYSWTEIVNTALHNIVVKELDELAGLDMSPDQLFKEYLAEFLTKRAIAATQEQVLIDRVFKDETNNKYVFKPKNLLAFLIHQKQFRAYGIQEIGAKLRKMGAEPKQYYVEKVHKTTRVWTIPTERVAKYLDDDYQNVAIDFLDNVPKEDY